MRLLLVEDERDSARMLAKGLREAAYAVDVAGDGIAALEKISINPYDAIILDWMLPGKSGLEVCREIRSQKLSVPVLMLTARDQVESRIAGLDTGGFLVRRRDEVVGRAEISEHVWSEEYDPYSNLIEVYIQRLRRKVDGAGEGRLIHTRRGEGYVLTSGEAAGV